MTGGQTSSRTYAASLSNTFSLCHRSSSTSGRSALFLGCRDLLPVALVVGLPVLELLGEPLADDEPEVRRHGDVAPVEEPVDVGAQQQTVRHLVGAAGARVRANVRRLQYRQGVLAADRARAP